VQNYEISLLFFSFCISLSLSAVHVRRLPITSKGLAQWRLHKGSGGVGTSKFVLPFLRATAAIAPNPS